MRVGALHDCPVLLKQAPTPRVTAASTSVSAKIRFGDLPPSSRVTRLTVSAAFFDTATPARVEPVKEIMSTPGWPESNVPTPAPSPLTRLKTPAGNPASCIISANSMPDIGAISLGFSTAVQPAASAGISFAVIWLMGQFQGVIIAQTPIGSSRTTVLPDALANSHSKRSSVSMTVAM